MKKFYFKLIIAMLALSVSAVSQTNNALDFRNKDRVMIDPYTMVGFTGLTVEAWIKLDTYHDKGNATGSPFLMQITDPAIVDHSDYGIILMVLGIGHYQGHDKQLAFGLNFGDEGIYHIGLHSGDTVLLNKWYHFAGVWDGTYMKVYIDGILANSFNVIDSIGYEDLYSPDNGMYLGYRDEGQYGFFDGKMDEVRIWNYGRSESEIRQTMYQDLVGNEAGLYVYYDFDQLSGDVLYDQGPNGFDGYLGELEGTNDGRDPNWTSSSAPIPYFTITDGNYDSAWVWASGQQAPINDWAQIKINDHVNLAADEIVSNITISTSGAFTIDNTHTLTVDGEFLIESDASSTGSFIDNGSVSYSGATVQRYLSEDRWHYVSSPIASSLSGVFTSIYLRSWDEPTETWSYITSTSAPLNNMQGYAAWASTAYTGATTVEFAGMFNTGNYAMSLTNTAGTTAPPGEDPTGYNFIGNPYPSAIDWDGSGWTKTNVDDAIYVITYIGGVRQYASYVGGVSTNGLTNEIAPHQGFFVKCNNTSGGNIQVSNDARIHTGEAFFKSTLEEPSMLVMRVEDAQGLYDETVVRLKEEATDGFDGAWDAYKLKGGEDIPQLYTCFDSDIIYSINSLGLIESNTIIPLHFEAGENGIYKLSLKLAGDMQDLPVLLEDKKEGIIFNPKTSVAYEFVADQADDPNRFQIRFTYNDTELNEIQNTDALVFTKNQKVIVNLKETETAKANVYDLSGRLVGVSNLSNGTNTIDINANSGYFLVEIVTPEYVKTSKVFIR